MNDVQEIVPCPGCQGTRQEYNSQHHKLIQCLVCVGRGWVVLESCKGCGYPAQAIWPRTGPPLLRYCGTQVCLNKLVTFHKPKEPPKVELVDGPGGLKVMREFRERLQRDDAEEELKFKSRFL